MLKEKWMLIQVLNYHQTHDGVTAEVTAVARRDNLTRCLSPETDSGENSCKSVMGRAYHRYRGPNTNILYTSLVCLLAGCLMSQQHARVFQGRICSDKFTCCHTETEAADQILATLPGARCYRVSAGTGWRGVSIL